MLHFGSKHLVQAPEALLVCVDTLWWARANFTLLALTSTLSQTDKAFPGDIILSLKVVVFDGENLLVLFTRSGRDTREKPLINHLYAHTTSHGDDLWLVFVSLRRVSETSRVKSMSTAVIKYESKHTREQVLNTHVFPSTSHKVVTKYWVIFIYKKNFSLTSN